VNEFTIDWDNWEDKSNMLDPDRFGYLSVHYIATLSPERIALMDYKKFSSCQFEIQVRSILQHAWAEIEHDLGYKSEIAIPRDVRRRFARMAGLLETADEEFGRIRDEREKYLAVLAVRAGEGPEDILVDQDSLTGFVASNNLADALDVAITESAHVGLRRGYSEDSAGFYAWAGTIVPCFQFLGINTLQQLRSALEAEESDLLTFAAAWLNRDESEVESRKNSWDEDGPLIFFHEGIAIGYLGYLLATRMGIAEGKAYLEDYLLLGKYARPGEETELADELLALYRQVFPVPEQPQ